MLYIMPTQRSQHINLLYSLIGYIMSVVHGHFIVTFTQPSISVQHSQ